MSSGGWRRALNGRAVFLSASVPDPRREAEYRVDHPAGGVYERVEDAHVEVEQAVVSLTRAVFSRGGRMVFGGHPSISPLVALVAGEYRVAPPAERGPGERQGAAGGREGSDDEVALVTIYQSRAYEGVVPDDTWLLSRLGYARIRWTPAVKGERYSPELSGQPQCPHSLALMRQTLLEQADPIAMVAIGGMKGVRDEVEGFRGVYPTRPVYVIASTGGAAGWLAERGEGVDVIDRRVLAQLRALPLVTTEPGHEGPASRESTDRRWHEPTDPYRFTPYPLIMQLLVEELMRSDDLHRRPR